MKMNIKQQKQIHTFLTKEFGKEKGGEMFRNEETSLEQLINGTKDKSEAQMQTLRETILPRIALYKVLCVSLGSNAAYPVMRNYMLNVVAAKKHKATMRLEIIPFFYSVYSRVFLKIMKTTDLQVSTQESGKDYYDITITKCLWHTACAENGCGELCPLFCEVDDVTYGGLRKIGFTRTKTLGCGGDCCDFHFFRK